MAVAERHGQPSQRSCRNRERDWDGNENQTALGCCGSRLQGLSICLFQALSHRLQGQDRRGVLNGSTPPGPVRRIRAGRRSSCPGADVPGGRTSETFRECSLPGTDASPNGCAGPSDQRLTPGTTRSCSIDWLRHRWRSNEPHGASSLVHCDDFRGNDAGRGEHSGPSIQGPPAESVQGRPCPVGQARMRVRASRGSAARQECARQGVEPFNASTESGDSNVMAGCQACSAVRDPPAAGAPSMPQWYRPARSRDGVSGLPPRAGSLPVGSAVTRSSVDRSVPKTLRLGTQLNGGGRSSGLWIGVAGSPT